MMTLSISRRSSSESRISSSTQPAVVVEPAEQRVGDGLRLLVDLLEHEVVVAALLGGRQVPVDVVLAHLARVAVEVGDGDAVAAQLDDLVLAELDRVAGVRDERRDVGGEEVLALAAPDDQRRVAPGADHDVGGVGVDGDQGEGALEPAADARASPRRARPSPPSGTPPRAGARPPRCRCRCASSWPRASSSARSGAKFSMMPLWMTATVPVQSTCGWALRSLGAPWVAQRVWPMPVRGRRQRALVEQRLEVGQLAARFFAVASLPSAEHRDSGRVVAAVLQPPQALDHDPEGGLLTDVAHDSAHG